MLAIQMYIPGDQELTRVLREGLVRRVLLMLTLLLRSISPAVRRRYPTLQTLVKEGRLHNPTICLIGKLMQNC